MLTVFEPVIGRETVLVESCCTNVGLERIARSHTWLTRPFFCSSAETHFLFVRVGKSRRGFFHGAHSDPASTRFPQDTRSSRGLDETALALSRDGPNSCSHGGLARKRPGVGKAREWPGRS
jgi:hypothetical protein